MTTMSQLHEEYLMLMATRQRLIDERAALHQVEANGAAFQDHAHRTRQYVNAHDAYVAKLSERRKELARVTKGS
jgi:hypothetical protein